MMTNTNTMLLPHPQPLAEARASHPAALRGPDDGRFLSAADCQTLVKRAASLARGGGDTRLFINSSWTGYVRWGRNRIATMGDVRDHDITLSRRTYAAEARVRFNMLDDACLEAAVRRAERLQQLRTEEAGSMFPVYPQVPLRPPVWSDHTYHLDAAARAEVARALIQEATHAGVSAAGYIEVAGTGRGVLGSDGQMLYVPFTSAQFSVRAQAPGGTGVGWAGVTHWDWAQIDPLAVTRTAIEKCLAARHPVALEPGRYTTILEPQAVAQLVAGLWGGNIEARREYEAPEPKPPFGKGNGQSRLGEIVMDERLTVETDPMDPALAHAPFGFNSNNHDPISHDLEVYYPAVWIKDGRLMNLSYGLTYAMRILGKNTGLLTAGAFRMRSSAPPVSVAEMIASTRRGILVSRFAGRSPVRVGTAIGASGYTSDGLWLVEEGKVQQALKNFYFEEVPYALLQPERLEQIGAPERVFSPEVPILVPALKVKDFNFTRLADAI